MVQLTQGLQSVCDAFAPARVERAYWKGAVAAFTAGPICWAIVLAVNLLITSPETMPRTPPVSLRNAVNLPSLMVCMEVTPDLLLTFLPP